MIEHDPPHGVVVEQFQPQRSSRHVRQRTEHDGESMRIRAVKDRDRLPVGAVKVVSTCRCPYKNAQDRGVPGGELYVCAGSGYLDYRAAWEADDERAG